MLRKSLSRILPQTSKINEMKFSHLFSIRPKDQNRDGRMIQITEMATDHIKTIISYAAADAKAQERIKFYHTISAQPGFRASAGKMFERFVLSWLYARSNVEPIRCFATGQLDLEIPACGEEQTTFFDSKNRLENVNSSHYVCCLHPNHFPPPMPSLLPTSPSLPFR